ncbi:hypothetical protein [Algoriphagus sediminis]|uniref:Uncharacterized protein n=1 Tax=Algoriphagus sediminis TaxID=3057113 RepID=A0ABT7YF56_9BACT|nr:hypothetical protein [Algoriphagus sediminis]MDN3205163.1 hypothetical protein [Algoriphagus sediminis]
MISVLMMPTFLKVGIIIDFKVNQDFIAEVLCINKEKPMMNCDGKCYLSKKLKKAKEQEEKQLPAGIQDKVEVVYSQSGNYFEFLPQIAPLISNLIPAYGDDFSPSSFIADIFHPPKLNLISEA